MAGGSQPLHASSSDPAWVRWSLIAITFVFMALLLILPLGVIFWEAFRKGWKTYSVALSDKNARSAIWLTLVAAAIAVPLNMIFGVAAAWCTTKYQFPGKAFLIALIDLPFAISPVIAEIGRAHV